MTFLQFVCDKYVSEQKRFDIKFDIILYPARILILLQSVFDQTNQYLKMHLKNTFDIEKSYSKRIPRAYIDNYTYERFFLDVA